MNLHTHTPHTHTHTQVTVDNKVSYVDSTDENNCNWMMFIRPALNTSHLNMVAYENKGQIFFDVIKDIKPKEEFRVTNHLINNHYSNIIVYVLSVDLNYNKYINSKQYNYTHSIYYNTI